MSDVPSAYNNGALSKMGLCNKNNVELWLEKFEIVMMYEKIPENRITLELMGWLDPKLFKAVKETGFNISSSFQEIRLYLINRFGKKGLLRHSVGVCKMQTI